MWIKPNFSCHDTKGQPSVLLKRMVAAIGWIGFFVSPTLFGMWLKGLGESKEEGDEK